MDIYVSDESLASLDQLIVDLSAVRTELEDMSEPLKKIKDYMNQRWEDNFHGEGSIYTSWAALSPTWTVIERGSTNPILFRGGGLLTHFLEQNAAGKVTTDAASWSFTNDASSGGWTVRHDEGYPNPIANRANIPARPLWGINNDDETRIEEELSLYIDDVLMSHHL